MPTKDKSGSPIGEILNSKSSRDQAVSRNFWLSSELQEILTSILGQLDSLISCDACVLLLLRDGVFSVAASKGLSDPNQIERIRINLRDFPQLQEMMQEGFPIISQNGVTRALFKDTEVCRGDGDFVQAPLVYRGRPIGLLVLCKFEQSDTYVKRDAQSAMAFANQAALAIENARLYTEARRKAAQMEVASQVSQKVISILELDELLFEVVRLIQEKFDYYNVHIFLVDGPTNHIVLQELSGEVDQPLRKRGMRLKIGEQGITGWVAGTGAPLLCNDVSQENRYHPHELLPKTKSELAVPMRVGDTIVGVLDVQSDQLNAFQEEDVTVFQILADQVAIAIENAHLFQETRRQIDVLRTLHSISLEISSQLETDIVLDIILKQAARLLSVQGSTLGIFDHQKNVVRKIAGHNVPQKVIGVELEIGEGVTGEVIATEGPVLVNDYRSWSKRSQKFKDGPFNAVLGVPLRWQNQVIGVLDVMDDRERRPFTEDDAQLLTLFADLASIALKNSELYVEVRKAREELEHKVIQRTEELSEAKQALDRKAKQLQRLLRVTLNVQEEERSRIALDLHDGSNQLITGVLYEIQAAKQSIQDDRREASLEKLDTAKRLLRTIESENRRIIAGLRPVILDSEGLVATLKWYMDSFEKRFDIDCNIHVSGEPSELAPEIETAIYRIVQESLSNVAEHADAGYARIGVRFEPDTLYLKISDNGVGFDPNSEDIISAGHMGLLGMKERAESIRGDLKVQSKPGEGTEISIEVPLQDNRGG